jgi:hypothetical protein
LRKEHIYINIGFELEKNAMETFKVFKVAFGEQTMVRTQVAK